MKKIIVICFLVIFTFSLIGVGCKATTAETTSAETAAAEVTSAETAAAAETTAVEESTQDENMLDPYIAKIWAGVDEFRKPIEASFKGPDGQKVTLDTESLPLTVAEVKKIQEGNYTIAFNWNTLSAEYFTVWRQGALDMAKYLNIKVVAESSCEFDAAKQQSDIESMIPLKPDVIGASPIDPVTAAGAFRPALDAGIKLSFVSNIPQDYVKGKDYIGLSTSNVYDYGRFAFELLRDSVESGAKVAVMPMVTNYWFTTYYQSVIWDLLSKSDLDVVSKTGYVTSADATAVANTILTANPDVKGIIIDYAMQSQDVVNACRDAGKSDVKIITGGYDEPTLLNLVNGSLSGVYSDVTYLVGVNEVLVAAYGLLGKEGPEYAVCPAVKITLDNLRDVWAAGMGIPLPASLDVALKGKGK
jgi:ribose transport system substrate-binding protein